LRGDIEMHSCRSTARPRGCTFLMALQTKSQI